MNYLEILVFGEGRDTFEESISIHTPAAVISRLQRCWSSASEGNELRFFLAVPLLIIGSFLISITVDSLGSTGNTIMHMIGVAINLFAVFYIWKKKDRKGRANLEGQDDKK
jgi:hypothetical protein